jgi:hypothetical protein
MIWRPSLCAPISSAWRRAAMRTASSGKAVWRASWKKPPRGAVVDSGHGHFPIRNRLKPSMRISLVL